VVAWNLGEWTRVADGCEPIWGQYSEAQFNAMAPHGPTPCCKVSPMTLYHGSCHCGRVAFEVEAEIDHLRVCDCSICHRRGALNFRVPKDALTLLTPWQDLSLYQWGSKTAKDFFCPACGILPFRRPSDPTPQELSEGVEPFDGWTINVRCLDGVDTDAIPIKRIEGSKIRHREIEP